MIDWNKYPNFKASEFESPDEKGSGEKMNEHFIWCLQNARNMSHFRWKITSGYRTEKHNKKIGGSPTSSHLKGLAADIDCPNSYMRLDIVRCLLDAGFVRIGIGKNFIHVDNDPDKPVSMFDYY
ncbi:peptidase M15 [bacterium]|nr:MAG: peptidase M15 [bacterium]